VRDSCLPGWSGQELPSHSTIVVVCGGVVVVVAVYVALGTAASEAGAEMAAVGSVGPVVDARIGSSSVCWRRSSPPVNPIREHHGPDGRRLADRHPMAGTVVLTGPISPVVRIPNPKRSVLVEQQPTLDKHGLIAQGSVTHAARSGPQTGEAWEPGSVGPGGRCPTG
jgi:hypothetical protein